VHSTDDKGAAQRFAPQQDPRQSAMAARRARAGYSGPGIVDSCQNCLHRCGNILNAMRCGAWDFPIEAGGKCSSWEEA
jgi:hypothetical protein